MRIEADQVRVFSDAELCNPFFQLAAMLTFAEYDPVQVWKLLEHRRQCFNRVHVAFARI